MSGCEEKTPSVRLDDGTVTQLAVANFGSTDATVTVELKTGPKFPQTKTILVTAVSVVALFLLYFLQQALFPKMSAIALATCKSEMAQPLFLIMLGLGNVRSLRFHDSALTTPSEKTSRY